LNRKQLGLGLTEEQVDAMGYDITRQLADGRWLAAAQMFTNGRLYFDLDQCGADAVYCYASLVEAVDALLNFDPAVDEEPQGWHKCATDNRIRPGGDASKETIGYPYP
jgi:hypothetical protein